MLKCVKAVLTAVQQTAIDAAHGYGEMMRRAMKIQYCVSTAITNTICIASAAED